MTLGQRADEGRPLRAKQARPSGHRQRLPEREGREPQTDSTVALRAKPFQWAGRGARPTQSIFRPPQTPLDFWFNQRSRAPFLPSHVETEGPRRLPLRRSHAEVAATIIAKERDQSKPQHVPRTSHSANLCGRAQRSPIFFCLPSPLGDRLENLFLLKIIFLKE